MLDSEDRAKVERFVQNIGGLPLSSELATKANLIVGALNYLATNPFHSGKVSCPKFMTNRFASIVDARLDDASRGKISRVLFDVALMCKECMARTGEAGDPYVRVLLYYACLNVKNSEMLSEDEKNKVYLECYDCFDTHLLEQEYQNIASSSDEWFAVKKQVLDNDFIAKKKEVEQWLSRLENLKEEANKIASTYNLAGLTFAFQEMLIKVKADKNIQLAGLIFLGLLLAVIPSAILGSSSFLMQIFNIPDEATNAQIIKFYVTRIAPLLFVEGLMIYYFRVILHQYNSSVGQIAQLRLRKALCKFIEEHAEFKKDKDTTAFEKFDTIIFSPIVTNQEKIPSTLDGIDSLVKLITQANKNHK
ncbi:hypothetical protein [Fundidesulfovibrio soli]|uniref:hypothetical protein n=1 Tax=Fundidesulfovibrio soli TaxID=2922716 RepID=UPI001FAF70C8|nr:hypothetical protein [Fundidesulfovibrio soli]